MVQTFSEETAEYEPVMASSLFYTIPPSQHLKLSVILPVRTEQDNLFRTLEAHG